MRKHILLMLLVGMWAIQGAQAQDYPTRDDRYVNDLANILSPAEVEALRELVADVAPEFDLTVLTINSVADYDHDATIESYSTALFNEWGIGSLPENKGVLIFLAVEDRDLRIELGDGYSARYDDLTQTVIDRAMIPSFSQGNYVMGLKQGIRRLYSEFTGERLGGTAAWIGEIYTGVRETVSDILSLFP